MHAAIHRQGYSISACLAALAIFSGCGGEVGVAPAATQPYTIQAHGAPLQQPLPGLSADQHQQFVRGQAEFSRRWVPFPGVGGQWGRGPLASGDSCDACHPSNGRGRLPVDDQEEGSGVVLRLARLTTALPDPVYGRQLDPIGVLGKVPAEGRLRIVWREQTMSLEDGEVRTLKSPQPVSDGLAHGDLHPDTRASLRVAPALVGMGLLQSVSDTEITRLQHQQRGQQGAINRVLEMASSGRVNGKFGWKASQPHLRQQSALAFSEDIGVTSSLFGTPTCTAVQSACRAAETVPHPELKGERLEDLVFYLENLAVPAPRAPPIDGAALFHRVGCETCHATGLRTHSGRRIHPYTDLMLHDMGRGLADEVIEFDAAGAQWRTPPLWGLGWSVPADRPANLLHDGRAASIEEAILWHGGQGEPARRAFSRLGRADRAILLAFLQSL